MDVLTPNKQEAAQITGTATPEDAAASLVLQGIGTVGVTLGREGALAATSSGAPRRFPAFEVEALDTTAAGDAFNGALAVALVDGAPLDAAIRYAQAAAALCVTRLGAQPSLPYAPAVADFLAMAS